MPELMNYGQRSGSARAIAGDALRPREIRALDLAILAGIATAMASLALALVRFSAPTPQLLDQARVLAATGREPMPFFQTGYVVMLAAGLRLGGERGIFALQAGGYIADVLLTYLLVTFAGGGRRAGLVAALAIAIHPYLFFNIKRIVDNNLAVPALLLAMLAVILIWRGGAQRWYFALLTGLAIGFATLARSNFAPILVLAAAAYAMRGKWKLGALAAMITVAMVGTANRLASGYWRLSPSEGGYTFYIGANEFTGPALTGYYNSEQSLEAASEMDQIDFADVPVYTYANSHEATFWRFGLEFVRHHPLEYLWLGVLKTATLLRPDYRQLGTSRTASEPVLIVVQTLLALIVPIWLAVRIMLWREIGLLDGIWAIPVMAILMAAVFLVAGDPRYRLPIEIIAIADTVWCWGASLTRAE